MEGIDQDWDWETWVEQQGEDHDGDEGYVSRASSSASASILCMDHNRDFWCIGGENTHEKYCTK